MLYRKWIGGGGTSYTSSMADDSEIEREVVEVARAHIAELARLGLVRDVDRIMRALERFRHDPSASYEDIHEELEDYLIREVGSEGGQLGLGRSRNDHVAAAIRLRLKRYMEELLDEIRRTRCALAELAEKYADAVMPSYTHGQPAQASTLGHYMLAIEEALRDSEEALTAVLRIVDKSPLGAGAAAGVQTPIDRRRVARELGFSDVVVNALYASGGRLFALLAASATVSMLVEVGRAVNDLVTWHMPQIGYVRAPPDHASTSSLMPHKYNPVTLEVARARISEAIGHLVALMGIVSRVGMGYSLELQEATRHLWAIMRIAIDALRVLRDFLQRATYNTDKMAEDARRYPTTSSDLAERAALSRSKPYREAYFEVAQMLKQGRAELPDPREAVSTRRTEGSANPEEVRRMARELKARC